MSTLLIPSSLRKKIINYQPRIQEYIGLSPIGVILPAEVAVDITEVVQLRLYPVVLGVEVVVVLAPLQQFMIFLAVNSIPVQSKLVPRH